MTKLRVVKTDYGFDLNIVGGATLTRFTINGQTISTYKIGDYFITEDTQSPAERFGGSWQKLEGRFLLGADDNIYELGSEGGESTHTLTIEEMPSHSHGMFSTENGSTSTPLWAGGASPFYNSSSVNKNLVNAIRNTGGGQAHNNMSPYRAVYIWKEIA